MAKILGLDLGVSSIGWALIEQEEGKKDVLAAGVRIIPLNTDEKDEFSKGNAISKNQQRTLKRGQRRGVDRYQLRRSALKRVLREIGAEPDVSLLELGKLDLFGLRDKALHAQLSLPELGRVWLHLNQRRGYKSSRKEEVEGGKETEYVQLVTDRHTLIKELKYTIGQYFYQQLKSDSHFRVKQQVFPRSAYTEEFDAIWDFQKEYYPAVLSDDLYELIRNRIIYHQRPLKSQKGLVSVCTLESKKYIKEDGKEIISGPRVAPKSSPIFQWARVLESINAIRLRNRRGEKKSLNEEQRSELKKYLRSHDKVTETQIYSLIQVKKTDGWYLDNLSGKKGIQGNTTFASLWNILQDWPDVEQLLRFDFVEEEIERFDFIHGDLRGFRQLSSAIEKEPLYQLWHCIYSIKDEGELLKLLQSRYHFNEDICRELSALDFTKAGFGNKSTRAIRRIMPYLEDGHVYSESCTLAGYQHSDQETSLEKKQKVLATHINIINKNELRQPVVEKVLNQMIHIVNDIIAQYGNPDSIVVELARELKQSKDERNDAYKRNTEREREAKNISAQLEEFGLRSTRRNIEKYRLFQEVSNHESRTVAMCLYCGQPFSFSAAMNGDEVDVEHIVPRSRLFDDSFTNKTLVHQKCNADKGNSTAYDFMASKGEVELERYLTQIHHLHETWVNRHRLLGFGKRNRLLMSAKDIPLDFIERQLRQTQYVSKKALEILKPVSRDVYATSGNVTAFLRHLWGWNDVLMNLHIPAYKDAGQISIIDTNSGKKEVIIGWTKRDDHRHHTIDALVVACTSRGMIQRLNTLNQTLEQEKSGNTFERLEGIGPLKEYVSENKPFNTGTVENMLSKVMVSFKPGKKVATRVSRFERRGGKKIPVQTGIVVPRGALSEESIYGKIKVLEKQVPVKKLFEQPEMILKRRIREQVMNRLTLHNQDVKKAISSLKKEPLWQNKEMDQALTHATIFREEFVIKYKLDVSFNKVDKIVDQVIKQKVLDRLAANQNNPKVAFRNMDENPIFADEAETIPIKTVRCLTGLGNLEPLHTAFNGMTGPKQLSNQTAKDVDYVKPGNNHHLALYMNAEGKWVDEMCSFWEAVNRYQQGLPIISKEKDGMPCIEVYMANYHYVHKDVLELETDPAKWGMHLYRLQKISKKTSGSVDVWFRQQYETTLVDTPESKKMKRFINIRNLNSLSEMKRVIVNRLGIIIP